MKAPRAPQIDPRRASEFSAELHELARVWIPEWGFADAEHDFGRALLEIAARFNSEVAERLDNAGEKMRRGFLDWLAVRGEAARPARMPVVFKLTDAARESVLAEAPVRMQADAAGTPVIFETEKDLRVVPGRLDVVVGIYADQDAFYLPPPGLNDLNPLEPLPTPWRLKSFAAAGATKLQLDPEAGLVGGMIVEAAGAQYRITQVDNGIVTIDPPLDTELPESTNVTKIVTFAPFDGAARNCQEHALYLGHMDLLNIEAAATIDVVGASALNTGITWQYWGKVDGSDEVRWQTLAVAPPADQQPNALVLTKPKGAVEPYKIGATNSRWIRAYTRKVAGTAALLRVDALELRINCKKNFSACPRAAGQDEQSPAAEGMANTTPLVLDNVFFPLGKEPRQFDAFYLGSQEAFSKKTAKIQLCFEMADPTFFALSAVRDGMFANSILAGVAMDRALHLLAINRTTGAISKYRDLEPLQPPTPGYDGEAKPGPAVALDQPFLPQGDAEKRSHWRPPIWSEVDQEFFNQKFSGFLVAVSAGDAIWVWHEHSFDRHKSGWISFGAIPATTPTATDEEPVSGLVYLGGDPVAGVSAKIVALRNGQMAVRERPSGSSWGVVPTVDPMNNPVRLEAIVPVLGETNGFATSVTKGMVGVSDGNLLYAVSDTGTCKQLSNTLGDFGVRPVAVLDTAGKLLIAFADVTLQKIVMFHEDHGEADIQLKEPDAKIVGLDVTVSTTGLHFFASVLHGDLGYLASWSPQTAAVPTISYSSSEIPPALGKVAGAPTELSNHIVVPGARGNSFTTEFDPSKRFEGIAPIMPGIVLPSSAPTLVPNDLVVRMNGANPEAHRITYYGTSKEGEVFYPIDAAFSPGVTGPLLAYKASAPFQGNATAPNQFAFKLGDFEAVENSFILINGNFHQINLNPPIDRTANPWVATVTPNVITGQANYSKPVPTGGHTAPYMSLNAAINWNAALLKRVKLLFPGADPEQQEGKAFSTDVAGHPLIVTLAQEFTTAPPGNLTYIVDAAVGEWSQNQEDASANPELSWEYWNGKGWWKLHVTLDDTQNLKTTGALQFDIPDDIASSDWAGKTNFWIRARLIGGDYGREKVTAKTKTLPDGSTEQTVDRSSEGIRAPSVLKLEISYRVCDPVLPTVVLTEDSGSRIDQSDANLTGGALVEAFVPLSLKLGRLSNTTPSAEIDPECPPECDGQKSQTSAATGSAASAPTPASPIIPETGRALFVGLDATLAEPPVNVLLLVEENNHTPVAPITVEALVADRFVPIVVEDTTRALGESGVLSMAFALAPTPRELFGKTLSWFRLIPTDPLNPVWKPKLRGAYLNAVWASATESLTQELLGSSDGSPNLTLRLARPPVLRNTLELRVKEPLGEEERGALLKNGVSVLTNPDGMPGDWVLWKQVTDPGDEAPPERVYSLDEASGEIRFGDGIHGRIPPIGRDSIVAFCYSRTEAGSAESVTVPGNTIKARTALNLVSPVESVETVVAADQAAGGAPPESDERVLRFGFARLRHRDRAVTANDIEDMALQSSPDIVQAQAAVKRGYIRLVVVMKGKNPIPTAAQVRELRRLLLAAAPVSLSAPNALRIAGPIVRKLHIELKLKVESLDRVAALLKRVKDQLASFFDTATGGADAHGWAMGLNPSEEDIALVLIDTPYLDGIMDVKLWESVDGELRDWPRTIGPTDLVMPAEDPIRIEFETAEVAA